MPNAQEVRAISHARVKSDRFDAAIWRGCCRTCWWRCGCATSASVRCAVAWLHARARVRQRTRAKDEVHAVISRCLLGRPPARDLFGKAGRAWLAAQDLVEKEREAVEGCLRQIDLRDAEIALVDRKVWILRSASFGARLEDSVARRARVSHPAARVRCAMRLWVGERAEIALA